MRTLALFVLALAQFTSLAANADETSYICVADSATGFLFQNGEWRSQHFRTDSKFIVRPGNDSIPERGDPWVVVRLGETYSIARCDGFDAESGWLNSCSGWLGDLKFNRKTLKYLRTYTAGYVNADPGKENDNNPLIEIGRCSAM